MRGSGWRGLIHEPFTGAWQRNMEEKRETLLTYPAVYACVASISQDIGILPYVLKERGKDGIWRQVENPAYSPVLRKPNHYQTQAQFREFWINSKLLHGNTYVLKQRDGRGVVTKLYILDPCRVMPLVSDTGDVFYELWTDNLNLLPELNSGNVIVPASEIIHDREVTREHPLIGIPPMCAAFWPAVKNLRILRTSANFFANGASPGGILKAPGAIAPERAAEISTSWHSNFGGDRAGRVAVLGDGLEYQGLSENAADSQLVEQMKYSDEQICQAFRVPPFVIGLGQIPAGMKADDMAMAYYKRALQPRIQHMEDLLDDGLGITPPLGVELDLWPLLRMDGEKLAKIEAELVKGTIKTPDEARMSFDLGARPGGDTLWGQHQDYPLGMLAERNDLTPVSTPATPPVVDEPEQPETDEEVQMQFGELLRKSLSAQSATP